MRKFLSVLLTLCMALCLGLTLVGCDKPAPEGPGGPGTPPPAYSALTESEWADMLACSPKNNVYVVESLGPGNAAQFWITSSKVNLNPDGVTPMTTEITSEINKVANAFGFYHTIAYSNLTFNDTNDTYAYAGPITVEIPAFNNYSDDGVLSFTYTNIVIKLGVNDYDEKVIDTITATRMRNFADSSNNYTDSVTLTYSQFGEVNI